MIDKQQQSPSTRRGRLTQKTGTSQRDPVRLFWFPAKALTGGTGEGNFVSLDKKKRVRARDSGNAFRVPSRLRGE